MLPLAMVACAAAGAVAGVLTTKAINEKDKQAVKRYKRVNTELIESRDRLQRRYEELEQYSLKQVENLTYKLAQSEIEKDTLYIAVRTQNELIKLMADISKDPSLELLVEFKKAIALTNFFLQQLGENLVPVSQDYFSRALTLVDRSNNYTKEQLYGYIAILLNPEQDIIASHFNTIEPTDSLQSEIEVKQEQVCSKEVELQNSLNCIKSMIESQQYEDALNLITKAMNNYQDNDELYYYKSFIFSATGKNQYSTLDLIDKAIELNPYEGNYYHQQSYCLSDIGLFSEALKAINKAIHLLSVEEAVYSCYHKSNLLCQFEEYEEALLLVNSCLEFDSNDFLFLELKGTILYHLERYNEALELLDTAIEIYPESDTAWFFRGLVLCHLKVMLFLDRKDEALKSFNKAIDINPYDSEYWYYKSLVLSHLFEKNEAVKAIERAISIDSSNNEYLELQKELVK